MQYLERPICTGGRGRSARISLMANREVIDRELRGVVEWSSPGKEGYGHGLAVFEYNPREKGSVQAGVAAVAQVLKVMGKWVG